MADLDIRLRCTACRAYQPFVRPDASKAVVRCAVCHKRHSVDSLYPVDPDDLPPYERPP